MRWKVNFLPWKQQLTVQSYYIVDYTKRTVFPSTQLKIHLICMVIILFNFWWSHTCCLSFFVILKCSQSCTSSPSYTAAFFSTLTNTFLHRFSHLYSLSPPSPLSPPTHTVQAAFPSSVSSRISITRHVLDNPSLLYPKPLSSFLPPHCLDTTIITQC